MTNVKGSDFAALPQSPQPVWLCHKCGQPVTGTGAGGFICVSFAEEWAAHREFNDRMARERFAREASSPPADQSLGDILKEYDDEPDRAPWCCYHYACGRDERYDYSIEIEQVDTWPKVIGWWLHLMDKTWFDATDWPWFVEAAGGVRP